MEGPLTLSDKELNYYNDLFKGCDVDGSGRVAGFKVFELFKAAGLTADVLNQISELCGAKRLGYYGRSQFFIALKLITAAQNGFPVKLDSFNMAKQLSLPTFIAPPETETVKFEQELSSTGDGVKNTVLAGQLPPPPTKKHGRNASGQWRGVVTQQSEPTFSTQTQVTHGAVEAGQERRSPQFSPNQSPPTSPTIKNHRSSPMNVSSPVVAAVNNFNHNIVNSDDHMGWANFDDDDGRGLLGTGHKKLSDHLDPHTLDSSSMSSETDSVDDVWSISDEQRDYYVRQFRTMQPELGGMITGNIAKDFFEKSKLPVQELSKIWQLSDVNKDGALSLEEFCTAMHLVVLRRNDIDLPDDLPVTLLPYSTLIEDEPFAANLPRGATIKRVSPSRSPGDKQWVPLLPTESPLASGVASPGIKPVKFEVKPPEPDARIVHPVAVRMSPNVQQLSEMTDRGRAMSEPYEPDVECASPTKPRSFTFCDQSLAEPLQARPRPVPKKAAPERGAVASVVPGVEPSLPPPPQLPPRPSQHSRSISMDLKLKTDQNLCAPPAVPPRASPKDMPKRVDNIQFVAVDSDRMLKQNVSNLKRFEPIPSQEALMLTSPSDDTKRFAPVGSVNLIERHRRTVSLDFKQLGPIGGGTQITSAPAMPPPDVTDSVGGSDPQLSTEKLVDELPRVDESPALEEDAERSFPIRQMSRDRRDYQVAIRTHRERNLTLKRLNSEINQELQEVMEQRIALEIQLEHLRPFYS